MRLSWFFALSESLSSLDKYWDKAAVFKQYIATLLRVAKFKKRLADLELKDIMFFSFFVIMFKT